MQRTLKDKKKSKRNQKELALCRKIVYYNKCKMYIGVKQSTVTTCRLVIN